MNLVKLNDIKSTNLVAFLYINSEKYKIETKKQFHLK